MLLLSSPSIRLVFSFVKSLSSDSDSMEEFLLTSASPFVERINSSSFYLIIRFMVTNLQKRRASHQGRLFNIAKVCVRSNISHHY